jgi:alkaline phosphatase D
VAQVALPDGRVWRNVTTEAKSKVAETLAEYRGNYLYNLLDENLRRFNAEVPQIWQWDDHEVLNNWSDSKDLSGDARYTEKNVQLLAASETAFLGSVQVEWLKEKLKNSRATWKVIAADMPIGLLVPDGKDAQGRDQFEAIANGNGPALGRELETAGLLRYIKRAGIQNVVWLTADVHYCAAHFYDPSKAVFQDFDPFWEFVAGPLNAGAFGPNTLDNTFGPQLVFQKYPPRAGASPMEGYQFFGQVDIDSRSKDMTVALKGIDGVTVFSKRLHARPDWHRD